MSSGCAALTTTCCPFFDAEIPRWKCCSVVYNTWRGSRGSALLMWKQHSPPEMSGSLHLTNNFVLRQDQLTLGKKNKSNMDQENWESPKTSFLWTLFTRWATKSPSGFCTTLLRFHEDTGLSLSHLFSAPTYWLSNTSSLHLKPSPRQSYQFYSPFPLLKL